MEIDNKHCDNSDNNRTNFYFSGLNSNSKSNPIIKDDNPAFKFIVLQNDELHNKNKELTIELENVRTKIEEVDTYNDRLEKQKIALQGYLKNEIILAKTYKDLCNNYKKLSELYNRERIKERYVSIFIGLLFISYLFCYFSIYLSLFILLGNCYNIIKYVQIKNINGNNLTYINQQISKSRKEVESLVKANNLLDQLVDDL